MLRRETDGRWPLPYVPVSSLQRRIVFVPYQSESVYDVETFTTANNIAHFLVSRKLNRSAIGVAGKMYPHAWQVRICSLSLNS
jgi:hypothetical protein